MGTGQDGSRLGSVGVMKIVAVNEIPVYVWMDTETSQTTVSVDLNSWGEKDVETYDPTGDELSDEVIQIADRLVEELRKQTGGAVTMRTPMLLHKITIGPGLTAECRCGESWILDTAAAVSLASINHKREWSDHYEGE